MFRSLKNMAYVAIIAIVFAIGFPSQVVAQTDTITATAKIDGYKLAEKATAGSLKVYGVRLVAFDTTFNVPVSMRYDTLNPNETKTFLDSAYSPLLYQGPKMIYIRRTWKDTLGNVKVFTSAVRTLPIAPSINFVLAPIQVTTNKMMCTVNVNSRDTATVQAYYSPDGKVFFPVGLSKKLNPGNATFTDSFPNFNFTGDTIQYFASNLGGGDSTIKAGVTNYVPGTPWVEVDSAVQIAATNDFKVYGRCITYNLATNIKVVLGIGDTLFLGLPPHGSLQNWDITKTGATKGIPYSITAIAKNSAGTGVSTKSVVVNLPIDLAVSSFSATASTLSAQIKFKPEVPVGKIANFTVDIAKDSSFVNVVKSQGFTGMTSSSQIQSTIFSLDTGVYYARVQGYITPANGQYVKQVVSFTVKATPTTGVSEISLKRITVYPNPCENEINVPSFDSYVITNMMGQILKTGSNQSVIDVSELPTGIYIFKTETGFAKFQKN
ncbi:MAG: T9SS type A sorting domain-containing protein [Candidatus Pacebacteria bacterium]|nr:T9SS type A sorting domain-containing protein [Candidatus Paceibacterota bacterium]